MSTYLMAIRSDDGYGVYQIQNKDEEKIILKRYPKSSFRLFSIEHEREAYAWIGDYEHCNFNVSGKRTQHGNSNPLIRSIWDKQEKGYDTVILHLQDGSNIEMCISNKMYANLPGVPSLKKDFSVSEVSIEKFLENNIQSVVIVGKDIPYLPIFPITFGRNNRLLNMEQTLNEFKKIDDIVRTKTKFSEESCSENTYKIIKYLYIHYGNCEYDIFPKAKPATLTARGNFVSIDICQRDGLGNIEYDLSINMDQVVSISAKKYNISVTNDYYIDIIEKVKADLQNEGYVLKTPLIQDIM